MDCRGNIISGREMVGEVDLLSLGRYEGLLRDAVRAVKFRGDRAVGRELAKFAAESVESWDLSFRVPPRVLAVPGSKGGQRMRGFSLPAMVADEVCRQTGWRKLDNSIVREFPVAEKSSQGLDFHQRWSRHQSTPESPSQMPTLGSLLIVDDVVTTGATITANVETARRLGFEEIVCFSLAVKARATSSSNSGNHAGEALL